MAKVPITMKTLAAGPNGTMQPGKTYRVEKTEADQLVAGRYAVYGETENTERRTAKAPKADEEKPETDKKTDDK